MTFCKLVFSDCASVNSCAQNKPNEISTSSAVVIPSYSHSHRRLSIALRRSHNLNSDLARALEALRKLLFFFLQRPCLGVGLAQLYYFCFKLSSKTYKCSQESESFRSTIREALTGLYMQTLGLSRQFIAPDSARCSGFQLHFEEPSLCSRRGNGRASSAHTRV